MINVRDLGPGMAKDLLEKLEKEAINKINTLSNDANIINSKLNEQRDFIELSSYYIKYINSYIKKEKIKVRDAATDSGNINLDGVEMWEVKELLMKLKRVSDSKQQKLLTDKQENDIAYDEAIMYRDIFRYYGNNISVIMNYPYERYHYDPLLNECQNDINNFLTKEELKVNNILRDTSYGPEFARKQINIPTRIYGPVLGRRNSV